MADTKPVVSDATHCEPCKTVDLVTAIGIMVQKLSQWVDQTPAVISPQRCSWTNHEHVRYAPGLHCGNNVTYNCTCHIVASDYVVPEGEIDWV